jgi:hypothetical protein
MKSSKLSNPFHPLCFEEYERKQQRIQEKWKKLPKKICSMKVNGLKTYDKAAFFDGFSDGCTKFTIKNIYEIFTFFGSVTVSLDGNCVIMNDRLITSYAIYTGEMSIERDSFLQENSFMNCVKMINVQVSCFSSRTVDRFRKNLPPLLWTGKYSIINDTIVLNSGDFAIAIQSDCVICAVPKINDIYIIYEITPQILDCLRNYGVAALLNLTLLQEIFETHEFRQQLSCSVSIDIYFSNKSLDSFFGGGIQSLDAGVAKYLDSLTVNLYYKQVILDYYYQRKISRVKWNGEPGTTHVTGIVEFKEYQLPRVAYDAFWSNQAEQNSFLNLFVNCNGTIPYNVSIKSPYADCLYVYGLPIPWQGPPGTNFEDNLSLVSTNLELTWKSKPEDPWELKCFASDIKAKGISCQVPIQYEVSDLQDLIYFEERIRRINNIVTIYPSRKDQFKTKSVIIDSEYEIMFQIFYNLMFQRGTPRNLHTKNARYMIDYITKKIITNLLLSRMNYIHV